MAICASGVHPKIRRACTWSFTKMGEDIVAFWEPESHYQGWLETLHGGIQTTMMDELAGWVVLRKLQTSGVTSRLDARFLKSISTREPRLMIRGRIKEQKRNAIFIETEIYNSQNELCSRRTSYILSSQKNRRRRSFILPVVRPKMKK